MYKIIIKLIIKGLIKPRWTIALLTLISLIIFSSGIFFFTDSRIILIYSLSLQAFGVLFISLWNIMEGGELRIRLGTEIAHHLGGSVGSAFQNFFQSLGVGLILGALFIQLSEVISWMPWFIWILSIILILIWIICALVS